MLDSELRAWFDVRSWLLVGAGLWWIGAKMRLAWRCLRRFPDLQVPAWMLLISAPLPILAMLFGGTVLSLLHTPTSHDPLGDGFGIALQHLTLFAISCIVPFSLFVGLLAATRKSENH